MLCPLCFNVFLFGVWFQRGRKNGPKKEFKRIKHKPKRENHLDLMAAIKGNSSGKMQQGGAPTTKKGLIVARQSVSNYNY